VIVTRTVNILAALAVTKQILWSGMMTNKYSDIISDGGMDPRSEYEEARRPDQDTIKQEIWNRFMENMKLVVKHDQGPILPSNFLGSVEKHRMAFMKIDIKDLTK
jgi:hypothetical protein